MYKNMTGKFYGLAISGKNAHSFAVEGMFNVSPWLEPFRRSELPGHAISSNLKTTLSLEGIYLKPLLMQYVVER
jgi:hypothetical protein